MPLSDFLLHVFCLVDDLYRDLVRLPLRSRGPRTTTLTDAEVITIELVGEFLGIETTTRGCSPTSAATRPSSRGSPAFTARRSPAKPRTCTRSPGH